MGLEPKESGERCPVCGEAGGHVRHRAVEMLHGTRDRFAYAECRACGYLWLLDVPKDMGSYYPSSYYSYREPGGVKSWLKALRGAHAFGRRSPLSAALVRRFGLPPVATWLAPLAPDASFRILDVGCGQGIALRDLARAGFAALDGVEPFLAADVRHGPVMIRKASLFDVRDQYDVILLNHSFEHMDGQAQVLAKLAELLTPRGTVVLRMPIVGRAWRAFGTDWYSLDPPRHLSVHTLRSFARLVEASPLRLTRTVHDTDEHHYLASRQYQAGVPFTAPESYINGLAGSRFTAADVAAARREADEANAAGEGDQATFYLRKGAAT